MSAVARAVNHTEGPSLPTNPVTNKVNEGEGAAHPLSQGELTWGAIRRRQSRHRHCLTSLSRSSRTSSRISRTSSRSSRTSSRISRTSSRRPRTSSGRSFRTGSSHKRRIWCVLMRVALPLWRTHFGGPRRDCSTRDELGEPHDFAASGLPMWAGLCPLERALVRRFVGVVVGDG